MNKDLAKLAVDSWDDKKVLDEVIRLLSYGDVFLNPSPEEGTTLAIFDMGLAAEHTASALTLLRAYRDKKFGDKGVNTLD